MSTSFPVGPYTDPDKTSYFQPEETPDTSIVEEFLAKVSRLEAESIETIYYNQDYRGFAIHTLSGSTVFTEPIPVAQYTRLVAGVKYRTQLDEKITTSRQDTRAQITLPQQSIPRTNKHSSRLPLSIAVYINPTEWGEQLTILTTNQALSSDQLAAHSLIRRLLQFGATEVYSEHNGNEYKAIIRKDNHICSEEIYSSEEYAILTKQIRAIAELDLNPGLNPLIGRPTLTLFGFPVILHIQIVPTGDKQYKFTIAIPRQTQKVRSIAENLRNTTHPQALTIAHQQDAVIAENNRGYFTINLLETR
jgi:type II secretory ATPase GspE/PulE/Tfp pilus assembly ATPase PilB-like protein